MNTFKLSTLLALLLFMTLPVHAAQAEAKQPKPRFESLAELQLRAERYINFPLPRDVYLTGINPLASIPKAEFVHTRLAEWLGEGEEFWNNSNLPDGKGVPGYEILSKLGARQLHQFLVEERERIKLRSRAAELEVENEANDKRIELEQLKHANFSSIAQEANKQRLHEKAMEEARSQQLQDRLEFLFSGQILGRVVVGVISVLASFFFLKEFGTWFFKDRKPKTIGFSNVATSSWERIKFFFKKPVVKKKKALLYYNDATQRALDQFTKQVKDWIGGKREVVSNLLLYGPPGTGKSGFVSELARRSKAKFISTSGAHLSQLETEGARAQEIFKLFHLAQSQDKCILFIDEADQLDDLTLRKINNLVVEAGDEKLLLIFATNHIEKIDPSLRNRMGREYPIDPPDAPTIARVIFNCLKQRKLQIEEEGLSSLLSAITKRGWTTRQIAHFIKDYTSGEVSEEVLKPESLMSYLEANYPLSQPLTLQPMTLQPLLAEPVGLGMWKTLLALLMSVGGGGAYLRFRRK